MFATICLKLHYGCWSEATGGVLFLRGHEANWKLRPNLSVVSLLQICLEFAKMSLEERSKRMKRAVAEDSYHWPWDCCSLFRVDSSKNYISPNNREICHQQEWRCFTNKDDARTKLGCHIQNWNNPSMTPRDFSSCCVAVSCSWPRGSFACEYYTSLFPAIKPFLFREWLHIFPSTWHKTPTYCPKNE